MQFGNKSAIIRRMEITAQQFDDALKKKGLNRKDLASKLGISLHTVNGWVFRERISKKHSAEVNKLLFNQEEKQKGGIIMVPMYADEFVEYEKLAQEEGLTFSQFAIKALRKMIDNQSASQLERPATSIKSERIYGSRDAKSIG